MPGQHRIVQIRQTLAAGSLLYIVMVLYSYGRQTLAAGSLLFGDYHSYGPIGQGNYRSGGYRSGGYRSGGYRSWPHMVMVLYSYGPI